MHLFTKAVTQLAFLSVQLIFVTSCLCVARSAMSEQTVADEKTGLQTLCLKHPSVSKGWMQQLLHKWQSVLLLTLMQLLHCRVQALRSICMAHISHRSSLLVARCWSLRYENCLKKTW